jgi:hypothetical protein
MRVEKYNRIDLAKQADPQTLKCDLRLRIAVGPQTEARPQSERRNDGDAFLCLHQTDLRIEQIHGLNVSWNCLV